ncbi:NUDIX hydrolase [Candidatus Falkowbacteria bacterium]|jgi:ADP-ribose pyrophosphatase YjhB (NUDIX family)|nr:NUDIX hydrolase [Candidatus Falkowbacteria bacterium]MBT4433235.1 NUDIX hydrolase [Candidatus Falkowbacteria bacterium]
MNVKYLPFEEFKNIYSRVPRLTVEVIIKTKNGILLVKRTIPPRKGLWHIPGGTVLMGEKIEDSVKRVAKNELNFEVRSKKLLGIIEYNFSDENYFSFPIGLAYEVDIIAEIKNSKTKIDEFKYFKKIPDNTIIEQKEFLENIYYKK